MSDVNDADKDRPNLAARQPFTWSLTLSLSPTAAEELADFFDAARTKGVEFPKKVWAIYKQLENWTGEHGPG